MVSMTAVAAEIGLSHGTTLPFIPRSVHITRSLRQSTLQKGVAALVEGVC